jgi:hypothetical protein
MRRLELIIGLSQLVPDNRVSQSLCSNVYEAALCPCELMELNLLAAVYRVLKAGRPNPHGNNGKQIPSDRLFERALSRVTNLTLG